MIERCFNKLKNARRLATRYDKTAASYRGFINLVSMRLWLGDVPCGGVARRSHHPGCAPSTAR